MALFLLAGIAIVMAIMAVGVMVNGRCLRGSCGGADAVGPDGEPLTCATCPRRKIEHPVTVSRAATAGGGRSAGRAGHRPDYWHGDREDDPDRSPVGRKSFQAVQCVDHLAILLG